MVREDILLVVAVVHGYLDLVVLVDMVEVVPVILFLIILMVHNPLAAVVVVLGIDLVPMVVLV